MPKRKPPPAPAKAPMHERIKDAWYKHPLAIVIGIIAFLGSLSAATPITQWMLGYYFTSEKAQAMEARLHGELEAYKVLDQRTAAWAAVGDARRDTVLARNRVNDCNLLKQRKNYSLTVLEQNICTQYDEELRLATQQFDRASETARDMSRSK